jgi:hypothetical protein
MRFDFWTSIRKVKCFLAKINGISLAFNFAGYVSLAAFQEQFHAFNVDADPMDIKKLFRSLDCGRDGVMDYEEWSKSVGFHALSERDLFQVANRKTFPAVSSIA